MGVVLVRVAEEAVPREELHHLHRRTRGLRRRFWRLNKQHSGAWDCTPPMQPQRTPCPRKRSSPRPRMSEAPLPHVCCKRGGVGTAMKRGGWGETACTTLHHASHTLHTLCTHTHKYTLHDYPTGSSPQPFETPLILYRCASHRPVRIHKA